MKNRHSTPLMALGFFILLMSIGSFLIGPRPIAAQRPVAKKAAAKKVGAPNPVQTANIVLAAVPPNTVFAGPTSGTISAPPAFLPVNQVMPAPLSPAVAVGPAGPMGPMGPPGPQGIPGIPGPAAGGLGRGNLVLPIADTAANHADVGPAIQAAHEGLSATGGTVYLPSGNWQLRTPIWWQHGGITLIGEAGSTISVQHSGPAIVAESRHAFGLEHRPDLFGLVDSSMAPAAGQRWGLATAGADGSSWFLCASDLPPAFGRDDWRNSKGLTCSFKVMGLLAKSTALAGLGDPDNPSPWVIYCDGDPGSRRFHVRFKTEQRYLPRRDDPPREFTFGNPDFMVANRAIDVTFQVRFNRADPAGLCAIEAWQDGKSVPVSRGYGTRLAVATPDEPGFTVADAWTLRNNHMASFHLNNLSWIDHWMVNPPDRDTPAYCGAWIGDGDEYATDGAGNQSRRDGGGLDDAYRYLGVNRPGDTLIARLDVDARPQPDDAGRLIRWITGPWNQGQSPMSIMLGDGQPTIQGATFKNISIRMPFRGGAGYLLGPLQDFTWDGCSAGGGSFGVKGLNIGAMYNLYFINGNSMEGYQSWICAFDVIARVDYLRRAFVSRSALRFAASDVAVDRLDTGGGGSAWHAIIELLGINDYARSYVFRFVSHDQEFGVVTPVIRCERHPGGGITYLSVGDCVSGVGDPSIPLIDLADGPSASVPGVYRIAGNVQQFGADPAGRGASAPMLIRATGSWRPWAPPVAVAAP